MRTHAKVASKCLTRHLHEISAAWGGWRVAGAGKSNKVPTKPEFIAFVDRQFYWDSSAAACNKLILENTEAQKKPVFTPWAPAFLLSPVFPAS